jgi:hypothetical protein
MGRFEPSSRSVPAWRLLNDLRDLPQKVVDPNWMKELEAEEGK